MPKVSANFNLNEFGCKHCGKTPDITPAFLALVKALERARRQYYPNGLTIRSGYRCATHNRAVGGKPNSQHLRGTAVDIPPVMTVSQARACGFTGIGSMERTGKVVHVDVRATPATWTYDDDGHTG